MKLGARLLNKITQNNMIVKFKRFKKGSKGLRTVLLAAGLVLMGLWAWIGAENKTYLVVKVVDGDTIHLSDGRRIRYIGLNTPEKKTDECFWQEAMKLNKELVGDKQIRIETDSNEKDRFGRVLAYAYLKDGTFVNKVLIEKGMAKFHLDTVNLKHQEELMMAANEAHENNVGLWKACAEVPKEGCVVKGNYDVSGHRYYHLPEFRHYSQTVINLDDGDQWFCSEEKAIEAGFTRARE